MLGQRLWLTLTHLGRQLGHSLLPRQRRRGQSSLSSAAAHTVRHPMAMMAPAVRHSAVAHQEVERAAAARVAAVVPMACSSRVTAMCPLTTHSATPNRTPHLLAETSNVYYLSFPKRQAAPVPGETQSVLAWVASAPVPCKTLPLNTAPTHRRAVALWAAGAVAIIPQAAGAMAGAMAIPQAVKVAVAAGVLALPALKVAAGAVAMPQAPKRQWRANAQKAKVLAVTNDEFLLALSLCLSVKTVVSWQHQSPSRQPALAT